MIQKEKEKETEKEKHVRPNEARKIKGIPAEPHPLDRHSGNVTNPFEYDSRDTDKTSSLYL